MTIIFLPITHGDIINSPTIRTLKVRKRLQHDHRVRIDIATLAPVEEDPEDVRVAPCQLVNHRAVVFYEVDEAVGKIQIR